MSEDLSLKFAIDSADAVKGVQDVEKATSALSGTVKDRLGPATEQAYAAFEKLGNVQGIRGLSVGIVQAQNATDAFKKAIQDAQAAGVAMPPRVSAAVKTMQADIDAATMKLGKLRDATGDVRAKADALGQGWSQAAASGGSLNAMLNNLESTSSGATKEMVQLGLKSVGTFEAFKVGMGIGTQLDATLKELGIDFSRLGSPIDFASASLAGLARGLASTGILGNDFTKWANDAVKAMGEFNDVMAPVVVNVNAVMKAQQAAGQQLAADVIQLKAAGVAWHDVGTETTTTAQQIRLVDDALHKSELTGKSQIETIRLQAKALEELRQRLEDEGISLDSLSPRLRTAILLSDGLVAAHTRHALALKTLRDAMTTLNPEVTKILNTLQQEDAAALRTGGSVLKLGQDHDEAVRALVALGKSLGLTAEETVKYIATQDKLREATKAAAAEGVDRMEAALRKQGVAVEDLAAKTETFIQVQARLNAELARSQAVWDADAAAIAKRNASIDAAVKVTSDFEVAQREGIAFQGQATIIQIQAIKATAEQTAALVELLKAQNSYNDSLASALTAVDQWNNYLAILTDSYKNGTTSLLAYRQALEMFLTQLQQNFQSATGKAKEGLDSVIAAVRKLIETAGAGGGPSTDQTMGGALNRSLNKP